MSAKDRLLDDYAVHYARVNAPRSTATTPSEVRAFERNYLPLLRETNLKAPYHVVDVGCATGRLLGVMKGFPDIRAVGVDISGSQVEIAKSLHPTTEIFHEDGSNFLRRHPQKFSAIICNDVIEHIDTVDGCIEFVSLARKALQPGGVFVCRTPNAANLFATYSRYIDLTHERCFTSTSLLQVLEAGGLARCRVSDVRPATFKGSIQTTLEHIVHLGLFYLTARTSERHFQKNIVGMGFAPRP